MKLYDPWYENPKWQRVRKTALRRDKYMDVYAKRFGKIKEAEVVHHIFPKNDFPEYAYCLWNLISVSRQTHNTFHDRDSDELTEKGRELLRKTAIQNGIEIPEEYLRKKPKGITYGRDKYYV